MDPRTSAILSIANWPRVDANDFAGAPAYAGRNRAVESIYEPGSTFKAFTVAGALEDRVVTPSEVFHLPPTIIVADREIEESHPRGTGRPDDVADPRAVLERRHRAHRPAARRRPLRPLGAALRLRPADEDRPAGRADGPRAKRSQYSGSSMGNLPIGQGEAVTPIQLATAYAAIANGGVLRRPRIIGRIGDRPMRAGAGRRVLSESTAAQVRRMLAGVVGAGGTAASIAIPGYTLAGKTGTANKVDASTGEYSKSRYIASFVGFAPARNPKLLVTVMVDEPRGDIYGAEVAAPAFAEIMRFALPYLRIAPG